MLGDYIEALPGYILMSLGQTIFVVWFPHLISPVNIYLFAALFGFTYSGVMSSILVCTRVMVTAKFGARAMSLTSFFGWIGMGLGGFWEVIYLIFLETIFGHSLSQVFQEL